MPYAHRGHVFHVTGAATVATAPDRLAHHADGGLLVDDDGRIAWCGSWADRPAAADDAILVDHAGSFLLPGFVDTHLHFPQVHCVDAYNGGHLLEWLEHVIFPAEARLAVPANGRTAARVFCDRLVRAGTTTSMVFGSQFPSAQQALVDQARERGLRMILGRTTMTLGPQSALPLLTGEATALARIREEIEAWHQPLAGSTRPLLQVAIVPRFALSVSAQTLRSLGELKAEYDPAGVYFTTHLSENNSPVDGELAQVRATFDVDRYLDVYDGRFLPRSGIGGRTLLGRRSVLAHAVHCSDGELDRLAQTGSSIAHCPVSQQFLGSGTMPWLRTVAAGVRVAMGSDIAAGDEWFMPRVLNTCFQVHHGEPVGATIRLHPAQLLYLGTLAGAQALDLDPVTGSLEPGKDADFVVIDPSRSRELDDLLGSRGRGTDPDEEAVSVLFTLLMAATGPSLAQAYVRGRRLEASDPPAGAAARS